MKKLWFRIRARLGFPHPSSLAYKIKHAKSSETIYIKPEIHQEYISLKKDVDLSDKNDKSFDPSKTCCEGTENLKNDKTTSGDS